MSKYRRLSGLEGCLYFPKITQIAFLNGKIILRKDMISQ